MCYWVNAGFGKYFATQLLSAAIFQFWSWLFVVASVLNVKVSACRMPC
jgi:hypothetical protein